MMNRLGVRGASTEIAPFLAPHAGPQLEAASFSSARTASKQPLAMFAPVHYESNYAYPLVVWLHGAGDDENQLKRIMPLMSLRNYVGVAIRGTTPYATSSGKPGFAWAQSQPHVALAEQRVIEAIQIAQARLNISSSRVFLAGFDCGGTMALRLALAHPTRFAGTLSIGGEFPVGGAPRRDCPRPVRCPCFWPADVTASAIPRRLSATTSS